MSRLIPAALCAALALAGPLGAKGPAPAPGPVFTPSELPYPFSSAVQVGDVLYLSGQLGAEDGGGKVVPSGIGPESEQMFRRIGPGRAGGIGMLGAQTPKALTRTSRQGAGAPPTASQTLPSPLTR